ncbi:putative TIM-barrel fold metal-dependent hydrolase [Litorivivens lipolytica]|uniref:Putative TIM-barrel fold metal-dependent hydrolase n=1 Tax=Litorivivens lipolytica TaxID=1524264 RepID=A0A7W4W361_9GAMM|nr:amidohydrolase family protein [Litorivivens lipolytica]MBB3046601.1 putative TIM-barrel fold metal-dependent hydrolase [Litorivivens lipolytica]
MRSKKSYIVSFFLAAAVSVPAKAEPPSRLVRVDAHLHYVNFMQETGGTRELLEAMDEAGVDKAWIFGLPVIKKWDASAPKRPRYYLGDESPLYYYSGTDDILARDLMDLPEAQRERFAPFISGFNPTDMNAAGQVEMLIARYPGLWQGIGEILTRHDALTALTNGETARADHPALMKVYKVAARHQLPVLLHSNLSSLREDEPIYQGELENALKYNPSTKFVLAHAGTSESVEALQKPIANLPDILRYLLKRYDNLHIDLTWSVRDHYLFKDQGKVDKHWLKLIEEFPDRFLLGSDKVGKFKGLGRNLAGYEVLLQKLDAETAEKVSHRNAMVLLPPRGAGTIAVSDEPNLALADPVDVESGEEQKP